MISSGKCSLIIRGENLNIIEIEENLQLKPSRLVRKDEVVSRVIGKSQHDVWIFEKEFDENGTPAKTLKNILASISSSKDYLQNLTNFAELSIKCYVQSNYAQVNFKINPNILKELASMNIEFEVSILSWGGVESD